MTNTASAAEATSATSAGEKWKPTDYISLISTIILAVSVVCNYVQARDNAALQKLIYSVPTRVNIYTNVLAKMKNIEMANSLSDCNVQGSAAYVDYQSLYRLEPEVRGFSAPSVQAAFDQYWKALNTPSGDWRTQVITTGNNLESAINLDIENPK
jgi:hypothetical protein